MRHRGVFPFPVPRAGDFADLEAGLSRSSRRKVEAHCHQSKWVADIVMSLNEMFGGSEKMGSFVGDGRPTLSQAICLERIKQAVKDAGKPPAEVSGREALAELQTRPGYAQEGAHLAPMDLDLLSLPEKGSRGATMAEIFDGAAESFVQRLMTKVSAEEVGCQRKAASGLRAPYVDPLIKNCPRRYAAFCKRLQDSGLVEFRETYKEQVGVFTVWKKSGKQRLVIDARLANMRFEEPETVHLATGSTFAAIEVDPGPAIEVGGVDIADAFYHIELIEDLREFFALPGIRASDVGVTKCGGKHVPGHQKVFPCLKVVPMGWTHALWICQMAHQFVVDMNPYVDPTLRCVDHRPVPLMRDYIHTQYVDNFVAFSQNHGRAKDLAEKIGQDLNRHMLPTHEVEAEVGMETLGWAFAASHPMVGLTNKRLWKLRLASLELMRQKRADGKLLERLVGHFTFAGLLQRGFLSIFQATYVFIRRNYDREVELWPEVVRELRWASSLVCMLRRDLAAQWSTKVHATDASMWGRGVVSTERPREDVQVLGQRNDRWRFKVNEENEVLRCESISEADCWNAETLQREDPRHLGEIGGGDSVEVPLDFIGDDWVKVDGSKWDRVEPIPILEGRAVVWLGQHLARSQKNLGRKHLVLTDSMSVTLALSKGRSSTSSMNRICRQMAALEFATGMHLHTRWIASELNPADGPSRAQDLKGFSVTKGLEDLLGKHALEESVKRTSGWRRSAVQFYTNQKEGTGKTRTKELALGAQEKSSRVGDGPSSEGRQDDSEAPTTGRSTKEVAWSEPRTSGEGQEDISGAEISHPAPRAQLHGRMDRAEHMVQEEETVAGITQRAGPRSDLKVERDVLRGSRLGRWGDTPGSSKILPGRCAEAFGSGASKRGLEGIQEVRPSVGQTAFAFPHVVRHLQEDVGERQHADGNLALDGLGHMQPPRRSLEAQEARPCRSFKDVPSLDRHPQLGSEAGSRRSSGQHHCRAGGWQSQDDLKSGSHRRSSHHRSGVPGALGTLHPQEHPQAGSPRSAVRLRPRRRHLSLQRDHCRARVQGSWDIMHLPGAARQRLNRCAHGSADTHRCPKERPVGNSQECAPLLQRRKTVTGVRQPGRSPKDSGHGSRSVDQKDVRCWTSALRQEGCEGIGLEIFSGSGHLSRAMRRRMKKVVCFEVDICHGPQFNILDKKFQQLIFRILSSGKVRYVWLGTPCNSWSRARRWDGRGPGPLRDDNLFLMGYPDLSPKDIEKVKSGNAMMRFSAKVFRLCLHYNIPVALENPHTSRLWLASPIKHLLRNKTVEYGYTDFCMDGKPWRKRTRLMWANLDLRYVLRSCTGKRGICARTGCSHQQLQGSQGGQFMTLLAQPYPHRLCQRLAAAFGNAFFNHSAEKLWELIQG